MADVAADPVAEWLTLLSADGPLPVLAHQRKALLALEPEIDSISSEQMARTILPDPLLSLNILCAANERHDKHFGTEITTIEHAVSKLGVTPMFERVRRYATVERVLAADEASLMAIYAMARRCQHASWQARNWAVMRADVYSEEVWVAATLAFLPELLLTVKRPKDALRWRDSGADGDAWIRALGVTRGALREPLLRGCHIPELLRELLDPGQMSRSRVRNVLLAARLAEVAERGWWHPAMGDTVAAAADLLRQLDQDMTDIVQYNMLAVARAYPWNPAPPAAAWLPMLPGEWPEQKAEDGSRAVEESASPFTHRERFDAILHEVEAGDAGDFKTLAGLLLKGLREGLGLNRVLLAQITEDGKWMKPHFTLGVDEESPLRRFGFPLTGNHLFARLAAKPQGMWFGPENRDKYAPHIQAALRSLLGPEFFVMSLHDRGKPFAMIYADRGEGGAKLDNAAYVSFKLISLRTGQRLARLDRKP
jgi:HDOD domain